MSRIIERLAGSLRPHHPGRGGAPRRYLAGIAIVAIPLVVGLAGNDSGDSVVLRPETTRESMRLSGYSADTHFEADGLVLLGGSSKKFRKPPAFVRLSSPARRVGAGIGYHDTATLERWELPLEERYPIQLRDLRNPSISGFSVIGLQSRELPWRVVKAMWDGDALHVKGCTGLAKISGVYWENVEDGFGPTGHLSRWILEDAYMKFIRDDAVENDELVPGEIINCLVDGCFVFLSQRSEPPVFSDAVTRIRDCVVHIQSQPHDGIKGREWRDANIRIGTDGIGRAPGMIFKWEEDAGSVDVRDCVFRMDAVSYNGVNDMDFPPGKYENVTLVWRGKGPYPKPLPEGVSVTRDIGVWERARKAWIERLSPSHPAHPVLKAEAPLRRGKKGTSS